MNTQKPMRRMPPRHWASLAVSETRTSYILRSRNRRDAARRKAETTLTIVSGILLVGAYFMMLLPQLHIAWAAAMPGFVLPMTMVALALGLYAFATRGHTPEIRFDKIRNEIWLCSRNSKGDARIQTRLAKSDIQSMFIQRPEDRSKDAAILARVKGKARPTCLVRGRLDEIEDAYQDICTVLSATPPKQSRTLTTSVIPRRVMRRAKNLQVA